MSHIGEKVDFNVNQFAITGSGLACVNAAQVISPGLKSNSAPEHAKPIFLKKVAK
jgi:hypothetical protein